MRREQIMAQLAQWQSQDVPTHGGKTLAYVYDAGLPEVDDLATQALAMFSSSNGLDPTVFPSLLQMERELVATARQLTHAPDSCVGSVTSGGTESILLAVLAARDAARTVARPAMIVPSTIHAAFLKAAHYFGVEAITIDVDPRTRKAIPADMQAALATHHERVVLMAASAPSYAHGVIDPIEELAGHAQRAGVRFHVDACIGGWILPWADRAGIDAPAWDFASEGVTSISVDLHKYAYTPKGASLLMHRRPELRRSQFFATANWPGYTMINATTQSTKSGGPLAAAWAVVQAIGLDGYADLASQVLQKTQRLATGIRRIPSLRLAAWPESSLVAIETDDTCDVFTIADSMAADGWYVQPQMSYAQMPASLHLSVSAATDVDAFLQALSDAVGQAAKAGPVQLPAQLEAALADIGSEGLDEETFAALLALTGLSESNADSRTDARQLPAQMAPINAILDKVSPTLRENLLVSFLDWLSR